MYNVLAINYIKYKYYHYLFRCFGSFELLCFALLDYIFFGKKKLCLTDLFVPVAPNTMSQTLLILNNNLNICTHVSF